MSFSPQVSLVIVSRDRPAGLKRLLSALRFQSYANFEVVVVSNYQDAECSKPPNGNQYIRHQFFDEPNISAARNQGIMASAGEVIAFCDDDAIPEPFWLERLAAPFSDPEIGISGGFVRGRNGIDYQWTSIKCDALGDDFPLEMDSKTEPQVFRFDGTYYTKVQGTNCAFRKSALIEIGGFDENYRFFLDETDVSLSLAKNGWATSIVPLAEVQHGFEESAERTARRVPRTLRNIGASKAHFIAKHAEGCGDTSIKNFRNSQKCRLLRFMRDGYLEPRDVGRLMATLEDGLTEKVGKKTQEMLGEPQNPPAFRKYNLQKMQTPTQFVALAGTVSSVRALSRLAMAMQARKIAVTMFRFSYTALFHKRFFDSRGYWVQIGGLFGKSNRKSKMIVFGTLKSRANIEMKQLSDQRPFKKLQTVSVFQKIGLFSPD